MTSAPAGMVPSGTRAEKEFAEGAGRYGVIAVPDGREDMPATFTSEIAVRGSELSLLRLNVSLAVAWVNLRAVFPGVRVPVATIRSLER